MATKPLSDLTATWNNVATTFTAIKMNATDTASASGSLLMDLQVGGASKFHVDKLGGWKSNSQCDLNGNTIVRMGSISLGSSNDVILARDAANTLAQRNGANAQAFRVYNTYTDASNYERMDIGVTAANRFRIQVLNAGTGTLRPLDIGGSGISLQPGGVGSDTGRIDVTTSGLRWTTDNAYDIGASGATRPRNLYLGGIINSSSITSTGSVTAGPGSYLKTGDGNVQIAGPSDGVMGKYNANANDFGRLQFGGTTNSFGAIARDGAGISIVGGAGGSTAHIKVPGVTVANLPAAATAGAGARSFVTDALAPVFGSAVAGSGAVKVPVYSDGSAWNVG
jgi:hypothetical protein